MVKLMGCAVRVRYSA